jgi:Flp pilus assembly protein TadD
MTRALSFAKAIPVCLCAVALAFAVSAGRQENSGGTRNAQTRPPAVAAGPGQAARLNNIGVAYMGQQKFEMARKLFEQALATDPQFSVARVNLGIALLNQQKPGPACSALEQAAQELPSDPYAWYNLGLAHRDLNEPEKAITAFGHVAELVPDADTYYFIGLLNNQLQQYDQAIAAFNRAIELNPLHASAAFGLGRAYQRKGDAAAARIHLAQFQKITQSHLGAPLGSAYPDQGRYCVGEVSPHDAALAPLPAIPVTFTSQAVTEALKPAGTVGPSAGACFLDYDGDGRPDLFLISATSEGTSHLLHNLGNGGFEDVSQAAGLALKGGGLGCAAGDFDNDGHTDLAVCLADGVHLFHNGGQGTFSDVTEKSGIRREKGCVAVTFVDYDHDGDLDLYIVNDPSSGPAHNVLWRNNMNGTFTDVSAETGLGIESTGAGVLNTDFNNDRAIDFVFAGGPSGAQIYLNPREGKFAPLPAIDFRKENLPPAVGVIAFDFDKDGWMDLAFTHAGSPGISLWRNVEGKRLVRVPLPDFGWQRGWGLAALDYDNDGWLDLVAVGETSQGGEVRLLRNLGPAGWADVTRDTHLDAVRLTDPRALAVASLDGDGNPDLVVTQLGGPPLLLRATGANRHKWVRLDLKALFDNKSAIGTKVELFAGVQYQKWEVQGASGYLSQNAAPVLAGLGNEKEADVVRLLWPTGVPQDEIQLAAGAAHTVEEIDRRGSSCPVLFAWNGHEYEFISDMIGAGVVGHWVAPGERNVPNPREYLKVEGKSVRPRPGPGLLSFRFMEPMEETVYLDQVRLLAVDHPASLEVYPDERFASAPPFPEFRVIPAGRDAHLPAGAWDDKGSDVLELLSRRDRRYVTDFETLPFAGFAKLHWIELNLGAWDPQRPLRLLLHGYTDYFTATSMYAADQAGIKVIPPYVEALDAAGHWTRVVDDLGFPAGLARTMIGDLTGKLPTGTRRIRIVTNLKIYWDQVLIDSTSDPQPMRVSEVPLAAAALDFLGYPREIALHPRSDVVYSYSSRSRTAPYARAAGNYTRYGDVRELLRTADDRLVVFGSGEGVKLDFDPRQLPPLPQGWFRDYFFFADGFEKDLDFYAAHGFTVEPLPYHTLMPYPYAEGAGYPADAAHVGYQLEYNTRSRSGRLPASLRYAYGPPQ